MNKTFIPYGKQWLDESDVQEVVETLQSDFITQGPRIEEFEEKLADYCQAKYAVAFSSGTAALHAAAFAVGIREDDEAITSPISFVATANSVLFQQGRPVFADVELDTINIDPQEVEKKITKRTKAIIPIDFAGYPAPLDALKRIAEKKGLAIIEDAAHALGASYEGKKIGGLSDITTFSFHPVKHITTGEGGMALTNRSDLYKRLKPFRNHGMVRNGQLSKRYGPWYYAVEELGYNYRLTDIQSSLGISQLRKIENFLRLRRKVAKRYLEKLKDTEEIILPREKPGIISSFHLFVIQLRLEKLSVKRRTIFEELRKRNIGVNVHYIPIPLQPYYRRRFGFRRGDFPRAELYYQRAISLPLFPQMGEEDVDYIVKVLKEIISNYRR